MKHQRLVTASVLASLLVLGATVVLIAHAHAVAHHRHPLPPDRGLEEVQGRGVLRVAMDASYPPFAVAETSGAVVGFNVQLAHAIAAELGVKSQVINISDDGLRDALIADKADAVISQIQPLRAFRLLYSVPYYNAGLVLVVPRDSQLQPDPAALRGRPVGVEWGGSADEWIHAHRQLGIHVDRFETTADAMKALEAGQVATVLTDAPQAALALRHNGALRVLSPPLTSRPYVVAVAPQNKSLIKAIDSAIETLKTDGNLQQIISTYI
ncbi:MAG: ABC transporter substrate-binding protein [Chloroflexi bacterium]|nr:ABC transporter substrate-binding protein [Chloroflexota bacterium]